MCMQNGVIVQKTVEEEVKQEFEHVRNLNLKMEVKSARDHPQRHKNVTNNFVLVSEEFVSERD